MGKPREAAALQHGDMLPYGVDLPYIRPALEEVGRKLLQIRELDRCGRIGEQRRGPTRDEGEKHVFFSQGLCELLYSAGRLHATLIRLGVGGEDGLEARGTWIVAVFGCDQPA